METDNTLRQYRGLKVFVYWVGAVSTIVVLGVAAYGLWCVRQYIPYVGYAWLFTAAFIPGLLLITAGTFLVKWICKAEVIELGPQGNVVRWFNKITPIHPLGVQEYKAAAAPKEKAPKAEIPALVDILKEGLLGSADLLLGYKKDGTPRYGTWNDLRTFVIAGKSRSGKTVTEVFFIIQALMAGAKVWLCDPHYNKPTGLIKVIEPLAPHLRVARTATEIINLTVDFRNEMNAREAGTSAMGNYPIVLVFDEWTKLLRDLDKVEKDLLVNTVLGAAEEWANFEGYAFIAGHEWTARESGGSKGAAIRRGMHAAFVHRLDEDYAKFLLTGSKGRKAAKNTPNLPTGVAYFQDSEGDLEELIIPYYGRNKEAIYEVHNYLQAIGYTSTPMLDGPEPVNSVNTPADSKQDVYTPVNKPAEAVHSNVPQVYIPATDFELVGTQDLVNAVDVNTETLEASSSLDLETVVLRMHTRKVPLRDIAYVVQMYGRNYEDFQALCKKLNIAASAK